MNSELALKLKNAGFLQPSLYGIPVFGKGAIQEDGLYYPGLSELIKSCGVDFGELVGPEHNVLNKWFCGGKRPIADSMWEIETTGDTPEEAVALLWLELNKKI